MENKYFLRDTHPEMIFLKEFVEKQVLEGKTITELLMYNGVSLWWFAERWMADSCMYHFPSLKGIFKGETPGKKTVTTPVTNYLLEHLEQHRFWLRKKLIHKNSVFGFDKDKQKEAEKKEKKTKGTRVVVTTHPSYISNEKNIRIGPLIDTLRLQKRDMFVFYYDDLASLGARTGVQTKQFTDTNPIEYFYSSEIRKQVKTEKKRLWKLWEELENSIDFKKALQVEHAGKRYNLYYELREKFALMFAKVLPEAITYIELSRVMLSYTKPDVVVTMSGNTIPGKSVVAAAQMQGVACLELQEGMLGYDLDYIHTPHEVVSDYPLPNVYGVYGEETKQFLVKEGNYPKEKIKIVGQLASDTLFATKEQLAKKEVGAQIRSKFGLLKQRKIVTYATNIDKEAFKIKELCNSLFSAIKKINDEQVHETNKIQLVVKLHPRDTNQALYEELVKEAGLENVVFLKDIILAELFGVSDCLVAESSTVVLEALMYDLPVLLICFATNILSTSYMESGAVLAVEDKKQLKENVFSILFSDSVTKSLAKKRGAFVAHQAYKIDGNCAKRVIELIDTLNSA